MCCTTAKLLKTQRNFGLVGEFALSQTNVFSVDFGKIGNWADN